MAKIFKTKQTLVNTGFIQPSGQTLLLSGHTLIASGATLKYTTNQSSTYTNRSVVDKEYVDSHSGITGNSFYNLSSPSAIPLGGICAGTILTGKTSFQLFEELLVPTLYPSFVSPSNGFSKTSPAGTCFEIGCSQTICFGATFSQGSISPAYCGGPSLRSGLPSCYNYTGTGLPTCAISSSLSNNQCVSSYVTLIGNQSWSSSVTFLTGAQPKDSKGNNYCSPYPAGTTGSITSSFEGVYPLFGTTALITTLTKQSLVSMLTANCVQLNLVADSSPDKQKFEIPCAWLGAPTSRPLVGVQQYNTVSSQWEYPGGCAACSLAIWTTSSISETIQGNPIGYCRYTYNSTDRSCVCIRLVF